MNMRAIKAIVRKDLQVVLQNKGVTLPLVIVPLFILVLWPGLVGLLPTFLPDIATSSINGLDSFLAQMPAGLEAKLVDLSESQRITYLAIVYFMAPLYLVLPLMVASVIAADSFAGEKERKTLEALLYTPTSDRELFVAKLMTAWLPAVVISFMGFVVYGLVANLAAWSVMGRIFFPNLMWLLLVFLVAPAAAGLGLAAMVIVSTRAEGFQDAYQMGAVVVLPLVILVIAQAAGVIYFSLELVLLLGLVLWVLDALLIWIGSRTFQRGALISRL